MTWLKGYNCFEFLTQWLSAFLYSFFLPLCLIICTAFSLLLAPNLYNCPGLDGPAEADAGGGHCGQEGAGTRTISQVSLLLQTDQYACPYNKDYFLKKGLGPGPSAKSPSSSKQTSTHAQTIRIIF